MSYYKCITSVSVNDHGMDPYANPTVRKIPLGQVNLLTSKRPSVVLDQFEYLTGVSSFSSVHASYNFTSDFWHVDKLWSGLVNPGVNPDMYNPSEYLHTLMDAYSCSINKYSYARNKYNYACNKLPLIIGELYEGPNFSLEQLLTFYDAAITLAVREGQQVFIATSRYEVMKSIQLRCKRDGLSGVGIAWDTFKDGYPTFRSYSELKLGLPDNHVSDVFNNFYKEEMSAVSSNSNMGE